MDSSTDSPNNLANSSEVSDPLSVTCRREAETLRHTETIEWTGSGEKDRQTGKTFRQTGERERERERDRKTGKTSRQARERERETDRQTDCLNKTRQRES